VSEEVRLLELLAQKEARIRYLEAENERQDQELKLLKEIIDLLIRRIFGAKSEKLDIAQLELLFKEDAQWEKADASAEKAEAGPGNGKTGLGYLWAAQRPGENVLFEWHTSRETNCLQNLIPIAFGGAIQCDGYSAYHRSIFRQPIPEEHASAFSS
jgi:hypothetical protein